MDISFYPTLSVEQLADELATRSNNNNVKSIMLLSANTTDAETLTPILKEVSKPIFGGIFPGLIYFEEKFEKGYIIVSVTSNTELVVLENISSSNSNFEDILLQNVPKFAKTKTMFVYVDGLSRKINSLIESLFAIFGLEFNYIGGGAGSLSLQQMPCIFTNKGVLEDATVLVGIEKESGIGVKHGWHSIAGPYKVTEAEGTEIKKLDYLPAFDIYKKTVDEHSGKSITEDNFFDIAKAYPFGISKVDAERIVRDPLTVSPTKSLVCVGEVETGAFVNILTGNKDTLVGAASEATLQARQNKPSETVESFFFVDCISRVLFLESEFNSEITAVFSQNRKVPLFGILSLGEIANSGGDYLEFYNKTSVVGCF